MAKEANGNNILGAQLVQASVLTGSLTIEMEVVEIPKPSSTIFHFFKDLLFSFEETG